MSKPHQRLAHAVTDLNSRRTKAMKIEHLLDLQPQEHPIDLLEIGCGSGGIASYFVNHPRQRYNVTAVDVQDNRQTHDGYTYLNIAGVELPFEDRLFDAIISNHVIEHVGERADQTRHLQEIYRVLKPGGVCYLATPNRWMVTEPHYKLKFLSWLPHRWRTPYLRLTKKGNFYDCEPFQMHELEKLLSQTGLYWKNLGLEATRATFNIEHPEKNITKLLNFMPDAPLMTCRAIIPTLVFKLVRDT